MQVCATILCMTIPGSVNGGNTTCFFCGRALRTDLWWHGRVYRRELNRIPKEKSSIHNSNPLWILDLVRMVVRPSGSAGQRCHRSIPACLPEVDVWPAFVVLSAGTAHSFMPRHWAILPQGRTQKLSRINNEISAGVTSPLSKKRKMCLCAPKLAHFLWFLHRAP